MRKLALAIVLIVILVGSGLAGMSLTSAAPGGETLKANGSSAPGTVFVSGSYWALGAPVDIYMDPVNDPPDSSDVAHHVAVAWPSGSKRNFSTSFVVGPTALGEHKIIAIQGLVEQTAYFTICSTQPVDDRVLEEIVSDPANGLVEIKAEVSNIEDALCHVAIINTYCGSVTWPPITGHPPLPPVVDWHKCFWFCQTRHVSLTLLADHDVSVEVYFPSTNSWGKVSSWLDSLGSEVKTYEFDCQKFRICGSTGGRGPTK